MSSIHPWPQPIRRVSDVVCRHKQVELTNDINRNNVYHWQATVELFKYAKRKNVHCSHKNN